MLKRLLLTLALLSGALTWPASAEIHKCRDAAGQWIYQDQPCAGKAAAAPRATPAAARPLFWEATSGEATVYLFGSVHVGREDMYPLDPAVMRAFNEAPRLAVEADVSGTSVEAAQKMAMLSLYPPGQTLRSNVSAQTWQTLEETGRQLGLPVPLLNAQKPWAVALSLLPAMLQRFGYDPELGVDMYLLTRAHAAGKRVHELESVEFQLNLFNDMSAAEQEIMLVEMLKEFKKGPAYFEGLTKAWREGNASALSGFFAEMNASAAGRQSYETLITQRNRTMARKLEELGRAGGPLFVVVGVGHLVGEGSVVDLMRERGWRMRRM